MRRALPAELLAAYDQQLRDTAEVSGAEGWERFGPLIWATYADGRGFISYRSLAGRSDARQLDDLVAASLDHFRRHPAIKEIEWKTRGHDGVPDLHAVLVRHGFEPDEPESVMIGLAEDLAVDVPLPERVTVRRITEPADVRRMVAMQEEAFGETRDGMAEALVARVGLGQDDMELWVAEHDGVVVSAGRLDPVEGSDFAGIWGGSTLQAWRGRGIYRALTAERARSALRRGKTLINSDSTEYSRPILERSGFVKVTTTTPYIWK